ncbi:MAG: hypothetical protein C0596_13910 [Marinilabiliales bacterium]|nr:MAG: hypothetical protein C0596_13910 [Marinilabiliales bacterium]
MKKTIIYIIAIFASSMVFSQTVYYVDGSVTSSGSGTSWGTAFKTIQEGINAAESSLSDPSSETAQVWVKEGTYYIYSSSEDNTIEMLEGVEVYGGFDGTETQLDQRDYVTNVCTIDGNQSSGSANQVKHVITFFGNDMGSYYSSWTNGLLDGFTITGGNIEMSGPGKNGSKVTDPESILSTGNEMSGAGILIFKCAPTVQNCIIIDNDAPKGGGMYIMSATEFPTTSSEIAHIYNCDFINNSAMMRCGGLSIDLDSEPIIEACKFIGNTCDAKGGGVYIDWVCPEPIFINCLFAENHASRAGAMGVDGSSSPYLINCTLTNNSSSDVGAGLYTGSYNPDGTASNEPTLINCIVSGNTADWGGPVDLRIWHDDYFYVSNSILGSGFTSFGDGVSYETPDFSDIGSSDYRLDLGSVGINEGVTSDPLDIYNYIPTTDIDGNERDANPDMGCYEYVATNIESEINSINSEIIVYPNPADDYIFINSDEKITYIEIYDYSGKLLIKKQNHSNNDKISIENLSAGFYLIKLRSDTSNTTIKLIKQ